MREGYSGVRDIIYWVDGRGGDIGGGGGRGEGEGSKEEGRR